MLDELKEVYSSRILVEARIKCNTSMFVIVQTQITCKITFWNIKITKVCQKKYKVKSFSEDHFGKISN